VTRHEDTFRKENAMTTTTSSQVLHLTDQNFDVEVLGSEAPFLVDFWADWCAPCRTIAPAVADLAEEYAGRLRVGKLHVDENPETAARFGIRGIPALCLFKGGRVAEQAVGARPRAELRAMADRALAA